MTAEINKPTFLPLVGSLRRLVGSPGYRVWRGGGGTRRHLGVVRRRVHHAGTAFEPRVLTGETMLGDENAFHIGRVEQLGSARSALR